MAYKRRLNPVVKKLICMGRNYLDHAKELGDAIPEKPVLFFKPNRLTKYIAAQGETGTAAPPTDRGDVYFETEVLVRLGKSRKVSHVSLGLDLTLRAQQQLCQQKGYPWEIAKSFKDCAVVGPWVAISDFPNYMDEEFASFLDGKPNQLGRGRDMRMLPDESIEYIAQYFPLEEGDVIFTGTPKGVGPVQPGQLAEVKWGEKLNYKVQF